MAARYVVRYGSMRYLGEFSARDVQRDAEVKRGDRVVVRSHRGTEVGEVLCEATERTRELLGRTDSTGRILRLISADDEGIREQAWRDAEPLFAQGKATIAEHGLPMQLVDVERLFGGEKLIFYYTSDDRVDFRELVRALAKQFKTRIEMRQIGIRDEAKLLADYGDCGKPVCCNTHLEKMPRVSMKMAKVQKASLDPNKISGRCGRLKCCLRYEYDTYVEHQKELPKQGKWIETDEGIGKVLSQEILAKKLLVAYEDGRRVIVDAQAVKGVVPAPERVKSPVKADRASRGKKGEHAGRDSKSDGRRSEQKERTRSGRSNSGEKSPSEQQSDTQTKRDGELPHKTGSDAQKLPATESKSGNQTSNEGDISNKPKKKRRRRSRSRKKSDPDKPTGGGETN